MAGGLPAIAFDLDGTLVDSVADIAAALNEALAGAGYATHTVDAVRRFVGDGARILVARGLRASGVACDDDDAIVTDTLERFRAAYGKDPVGRTRAFDGIPEALAALAAHPLAVLTNKPGIFARPIVDALFPGVFALVVGPDDLGVQKPNPAALRALEARLGTTVAVFIGDGDTDVDVAKAAGVPSVGVTWGLKPEEARRGDVVVDTTDALAPAILALIQRPASR